MTDTDTQLTEAMRVDWDCVVKIARAWLHGQSTDSIGFQCDMQAILAVDARLRWLEAQLQNLQL